MSPAPYFLGIRGLISRTTGKCSICCRPGVQRIATRPGLDKSLGPIWRCERHLVPRRPPRTPS